MSCSSYVCLHVPVRACSLALLGPLFWRRGSAHGKLLIRCRGLPSFCLVFWLVEEKSMSRHSLSLLYSFVRMVKVSSSCSYVSYYFLYSCAAVVAGWYGYILAYREVLLLVLSRENIICMYDASLRINHGLTREYMYTTNTCMMYYCVLTYKIGLMVYSRSKALEAIIIRMHYYSRFV